ncbi:LamG-like jellyroll fold domain-containing protein [Streptomyces sp. NRRL S-118]|uniref:LamG-like jellyroll fold domain-containing protein n=1 Tax=Streptomyces sp. NRRL S-118 TaxID=1463881 RepID=UPI001F179B84|nr:LamG-like jellyroll fold domain-containing protein [Streptomyces sp. NRRL S-118]
MRGVAATAVALLAAGGVFNAALSDAWAATTPDGGAESPEKTSSVRADDAARGKAFWQDDVLPAASDEQKASRQAVAKGERVEVASLTNETNQVFANSDGTFTVESSPVPERVRKDGTWVPIDTTLVTRADGTLAPRAAQDVVLSGGGSAPLATISREGRTYELGSPWKLPAPKVSGSTAVYESVRPDVDLVVQVRPDGFTQNLVVHTRKAATDPALAAIRFPVRTTGLSVRTSDSGSVSLVDAGGRAVFSSSAALMWDTAGAPSATPAGTASTAPRTARRAPLAAAGPAPAATEAEKAVLAEPGSRTAVADVSMAGGALSLTPDRAFLTAADTAYPVVIDPPAVSATLTGWTTIWSNSGGTSFWRTSHALGVGYDAYVDNKQAKSLFQFDTRKVAGKKILNATFTAYEIWSANCDKRDVNLYRTNPISGSTTWNNPPTGWTYVSKTLAAKGHSSACPDGDVEFNATPAVAYTAKAKSTTTTLGLTASASDPIAWKQFMSPADDRATSDRKPRLSITYVSPPTAAPSAVKLSEPNVACSASTAPALIRDTTPRVTATPTSADGSNASLRPNFELYAGSSTTPINLSPDTWTASGIAGSDPTPTLTSGTTYKFRARTQYRYTWSGTTSYLYGPWSSYCYFKVDATAPPQPTVTSVEYPECAGTTCDASPETGSVGQTGAFRISAGATDVRRYDIWLNGVLLESKTFTTGTASYERKVTPTKRLTNTLRVQTFDAAGNPSATKDYLFKVAKASNPVAQWKLDGSGTNAAGTAHILTPGGGAAWSSAARLGTGLSLNGTGAYAAAPGPVVDTTGSFSVAAWTRLGSRSQISTVASQQGTQVGAFQLYYSSSYDRWVFNRYSSDGASLVRAISTRPGVIGAWTHLLAVYDRDAQQIRLYVNGRLEATTAYTTPWAATGPFEIGRMKSPSGGALGSYFKGDLDQVQAWNRVVFPDEMWAQSNLESPETGQPQPALLAHWNMDNASGTTAPDESGRGNLLTLASGAGFTLADDPAHGTVLNLPATATGTASAPVTLDESGSFTVAGWVNLNPDVLENTTGAHSPTVFAHPGLQRNAFRLWYRQEVGEAVGDWNFGVYQTDVLNGPAATITSEQVNPPGNWIHVVGVFDSANQSAKLYLAGVREGAEDGVFVESIFQSDQPLMVAGARRHDTGAWGNRLMGQLDDLRVYAGVLSEAEITQLATVDEPPVDIG